MISHQMSYAPIYRVWVDMRHRCQIPTHKAFIRYGGRGIKVCERWQQFENFFEDMGPTYTPGLTLERINNSGDYTPDNCKWDTRKAQANNTRRNRLIDTPKGKLTITEAASVFGLNKTTLFNRVNTNWPTELLFISPNIGNRIK